MLLEAACSAINQCQNCTSSGCIWCGSDNGCHAEYSPESCIVAVTCDDLQECMREQPEYLNYTDYAHVNPMVTIFTLIVAVMLLSFLWIIQCRFKKYRKKMIMRHHLDTDVQMEKYFNNSYQSLYEDDESMDEILNVDFMPIGANTVSNMKRLKESESLLSHPDVKQDKCAKCTCKCMTFLSVIIILFSAMIILLYPTPPIYETCNTETDWAEIWSSLIHGSVQSKYDILLTLKNNNYFSIQMTELSVRIYYQGTLIGYWYSESADGGEYAVYIPSHAIVDVMAKVTFIPTVSEAITLYNLYEANALHLEIDLMGKTRTYLLNKQSDLKLFDEYFNLDSKDFVIGASIKTDRTNCNCGVDE